MGLLDALQQVINGLGFKTDLQGFLVVFGLTFARVSAAVALAPFIGGRSVSNGVKVGLSLLVAAVLLPVIAPPKPPESLNALVFTALLVKEALIGAIIGFLAQLIFLAVQMAGALIDTGRGMDQAVFYSPQLQSNASLLGQLKFQAALVLFLVMNGHLFFIRALSRSFDALPLFRFPQFREGVAASVDRFARISADVFVIALQLSGPVLITLFLVDVCFGAIGKVAPQVHLHIESQPVKAWVGLAMFLLAVGVILARLPDVLGRTIQSIGAVLSGLV